MIRSRSCAFQAATHSSAIAHASSFVKAISSSVAVRCSLRKLPELVAPDVSALFEQVVGALGTPASREVVGKHLRRLRGPSLENRSIQRPRGLDTIAMREEGLVAEHGVEQQALIPVGAGLAEGGRVIEVHNHRADVHVGRSWHLGAEAQGDAVVRLNANGEQVGLNLLAGTGVLQAVEDQQRRLLELNADLGGLLLEPLAGAQIDG